MDRSPDNSTAFFDIFIEVLQGDMLVPYMFLISLDYVTAVIKLFNSHFTKRLDYMNKTCWSILG